MSEPTRLRQGAQVGRTLYEHPADQDPASKTGHIVGMVDTPELAAEICTAVNTRRRAAETSGGPLVQTILDGLLELFPDAYGRNCTGDHAALKDDAHRLAQRVREVVADDRAA